MRELAVEAPARSADDDGEAGDAPTTAPQQGRGRQKRGAIRRGRGGQKAAQASVADASPPAPPPAQQLVDAETQTCHFDAEVAMRKLTAISDAMLGLATEVKDLRDELERHHVADHAEPRRESEADPSSDERDAMFQRFAYPDDSDIES